MYYAPIPQVEWGLPQPLQRNLPFDFNTVVCHPVAWPDQPWVDLLNTAKDKFEVDNTIAVFSMWRVQEEDSNS